MLYGSLILPPLPAPTKLGYNFLGWYNGDVAWDFANDTVTEDVTLVAKWEQIECTVTYVTINPDTEELETLGTITVYYGDLLTLPETPYLGANYELDSWRDRNGKVWDFNADYVTEDIVLQAYWIVYGNGSDGGVNGPWDEGGAVKGPTHEFPN